MKNILILITVLTLSGCGVLKTKPNITTDVKPIAVPIVYSPAPPVVARPELPHQTITPEKLKIDGEVVKSYAASIQALLGYSEQLEAIIAQYGTIHDAYAEKAAQLVADWKAKTGTDLKIPTDDTKITVPPVNQPPNP